MDGFWIVDSMGRFLDVNDAYCRAMGYSRAELLTMRIQDVEAIETPEEVARHMQRVAGSGLGPFETRHRRKNGTVIDVEISTHHMDTEGGREFVSVRDITGRLLAEEALRESEAKYRELVQNANSIIARIASKAASPSSTSMPSNSSATRKRRSSDAARSEDSSRNRHERGKSGRHAARYSPASGTLRQQ